MTTNLPKKLKIHAAFSTLHALATILLLYLGLTISEILQNLFSETPITRKAAEHDVLLYSLIYDFEREVVSSFLLNSDFFMQGADQSHVNHQGKIDKFV